MEGRRLSVWFRTYSERLIRLNSSLHPNRTLGSYGTECLDYPAPLPRHRGTPARRAIIPGMPIPRLDPEAGLARGCGEEEERINNCPVNIRDYRVPGEPLAPRRGIPSGRGSPDHSWRQGSGADGLPFICPFPSKLERSAVSPAPRREAAPSSGTSHRSDGTVLDTRRPPHRTSGIPLG